MKLESAPTRIHRTSHILVDLLFTSCFPTLQWNDSSLRHCRGEVGLQTTTGCFARIAREILSRVGDEGARIRLPSEPSLTPRRRVDHHGFGHALQANGRAVRPFFVATPATLPARTMPPLVALSSSVSLPKRRLPSPLAGWRQPSRSASTGMLLRIGPILDVRHDFREFAPIGIRTWRRPWRCRSRLLRMRRNQQP